jgi:hypothetical protein
MLAATICPGIGLFIKDRKWRARSAVRHEGTRETFKSISTMILEESPELKRRYAAGKWKRQAVKLLQLD